MSALAEALTYPLHGQAATRTTAVCPIRNKKNGLVVAEYRAGNIRVFASSGTLRSGRGWMPSMLARVTCFS
ncbi:MAG: hypothetical protein IPM39_09105 [Chloroflexi bacterium]|nr:hypothetical protein [Chloroflexota bacterium]